MNFQIEPSYGTGVTKKTKFKIQNFEHVPSKPPSDDPEEDDRKPAAK